MITHKTLIRKDVQLTREQAGDLLSHWLGSRTGCRELRQLDGGICSAVFLLEFDRAPHSAVVKLQKPSDDDPLPRERKRLEFLKRNTGVPCPEVYLQDQSGTVIPHSFLLLERLPGVNLSSAALKPDQRVNIEHELAEVVLELHSHRRDAFGEIEGPGITSWVDFFMPNLDELRLDMNDFLSTEMLKELDAALAYAPDALKNHGKPVLVHNDLWEGNIIVHEEDDGWHLSGLIDPVGLHYADPEFELAYLQALDTVGEPFFAAYTREQPLRPGYEFRRLFYWLHTYMVHIWLGFGEPFVEDLMQTSRRVCLSASLE